MRVRLIAFPFRIVCEPHASTARFCACRIRCTLSRLNGTRHKQNFCLRDLSPLGTSYVSCFIYSPSRPVPHTQEDDSSPTLHTSISCLYPACRRVIPVQIVLLRPTHLAISDLRTLSVDLGHTVLKQRERQSQPGTEDDDDIASRSTDHFFVENQSTGPPQNVHVGGELASHAVAARTRPDALPVAFIAPQVARRKDRVGRPTIQEKPRQMALLCGLSERCSRTDHAAICKHLVYVHRVAADLYDGFRIDDEPKDVGAGVPSCSTTAPRASAASPRSFNLYVPSYFFALACLVLTCRVAPSAGRRPL